MFLCRLRDVGTQILTIKSQLIIKENHTNEIQNTRFSSLFSRALPRLLKWAESSGAFFSSQVFVTQILIAMLLESGSVAHEVHLWRPERKCLRAHWCSFSQLTTDRLLFRWWTANADRELVSEYRHDTCLFVFFCYTNAACERRRNATEMKWTLTLTHCAVVNQRPEDDSGWANGAMGGRRRTWLFLVDLVAESACRLQDRGGGGTRLWLVMEQARGGKLEARSRGAVSFPPTGQCRGFVPPDDICSWPTGTFKAAEKSCVTSS